MWLCVRNSKSFERLRIRENPCVIKVVLRVPGFVTLFESIPYSRDSLGQLFSNSGGIPLCVRGCAWLVHGAEACEGKIQRARQAQLDMPIHLRTGVNPIEMGCPRRSAGLPYFLGFGLSPGNFTLWSMSPQIFHMAWGLCLCVKL